MRHRGSQASAKCRLISHGPSADHNAQIILRLLTPPRTISPRPHGLSQHPPGSWSRRVFLLGELPIQDSSDDSLAPTDGSKTWTTRGADVCYVTAEPSIMRGEASCWLVVRGVAPLPSVRAPNSSIKVSFLGDFFCASPARAEDTNATIMCLDSRQSGIPRAGRVHKDNGGQARERFYRRQVSFSWAAVPSR